MVESCRVHTVLDTIIIIHIHRRDSSAHVCNTFVSVNTIYTANTSDVCMSDCLVRKNKNQRIV